MRRLTLPCLVVLTALAMAACGGTTASNAPASQSAAPPAPPASQAAASTEPSAGSAQACAKAPVPADADVTVEIKDFKFFPDPINAKVGEVIAWTNSDSPPHTASLTDGTCGTEQLATGITGALVFSVAGTYTYQCNVHPGQMKDYKIEITE
jgi:plastocyanin